MTLRPTNVYRRLGEEFNYSIHTQLDSVALRRALTTNRQVQDPEDQSAIGCDFWTAALPLGPEFEPCDVSVKMDEAGAFCVRAEAASRWQPGDVAHMTRRIQIPGDLADAGSARCWIEDDVLIVQADWLPVEIAAEQKSAGEQKKSVFAAAAAAGTTNPWTKSLSLSDSRQRHGCLVKETGKGNQRAATKWTLDLVLPEFEPEEVTINRSAEKPGCLIVTAHHAKTGLDVVDSSVQLDFRREVTPPNGVQLDQLVTRFVGSGVLHLEAPAPSLKSRRGVVGLMGGAAGGAGLKIASLTRELRGLHSASTSAASMTAAGSSTLPAGTAPPVLASSEREAVARTKNCVIQ